MKGNEENEIGAENVINDVKEVISQGVQSCELIIDRIGDFSKGPIAVTEFREAEYIGDIL